KGTIRRISIPEPRCARHSNHQRSRYNVFSIRSLLQPLALVALAFGLAACGGQDNTIQNFGPEALYERGSELMDASNYQGAIQYFRQLEARYPFSNVTRQAQLDLI